MREAELRQLHNRQRAQLKAFLQLSAGNSKTIGTVELQLAAKLAKMSLPDDVLAKVRLAPLPMLPPAWTCLPTLSLP